MHLSFSSFYFGNYRNLNPFLSASNSIKNTVTVLALYSKEEPDIAVIILFANMFYKLVDSSLRMETMRVQRRYISSEFTPKPSNILTEKKKFAPVVRYIDLWH